MVGRTENDKKDPSVSTSEEQPQKKKRPPEPRLSKVGVLMMVSHLMEQKRDIIMVGGGKYLAWRNEEKIGKLGAAQFARKQQTERK